MRFNKLYNVEYIKEKKRSALCHMNIRFISVLERFVQTMGTFLDH